MRAQITRGKESLIEKFPVAGYFLVSVHQMEVHQSNARVIGDAVWRAYSKRMDLAR